MPSSGQRQTLASQTALLAYRPVAATVSGLQSI
jgi:hypothetical protein